VVPGRGAGGWAGRAPPFIVEEATKGPPWRYAQIPGFEILTRCSDRSTRSLAEAHYRLHALLGLLVPESLQLNFASPKVVIYYDEALQGAASREVMESMVREQEKRQPSPAPLESGFRFGGRGGPMHFGVGARYNFIPNLRLTDKDAMTVFAIVRDGGFDGDKLVLTRDYLSYLVVERTPTLPAWYAAGVLGLYDAMEFEFAALTFRPLAWVAPEEVTAMKQSPPGPSPCGRWRSFSPNRCRRGRNPTPNGCASAGASRPRYSFAGRSTAAHPRSARRFLISLNGRRSNRSRRRIFSAASASTLPPPTRSSRPTLRARRRNR
jgi:hypothetical protein